jgi:hypothetical protein
MGTIAEPGKSRVESGNSRDGSGCSRVVPGYFPGISRVLPGFVSLISRAFPGFTLESAIWFVAQMTEGETANHANHANRKVHGVASVLESNRSIVISALSLCDRKREAVMA